MTDPTTNNPQPPQKIGYSKITLAGPIGLLISEGIVSTADQYLPHPLTDNAATAITIIVVLILVGIVPHNAWALISEAVGPYLSRLNPFATRG